jgi:hypothetical protein
MIKSVVVFIVCISAALTSAIAQTQPIPTQVKWPTAAEPLFAMILPTGITFVKLDPATLAFDPVTLTIRALVVAPKVVVYTREVVPVVAGKVTVPTGCTLMALHRNGVMQNDAAIPPTLVDYTVAGLVVTFLPTSMPQAGDVITINCAR